MLYYVHFDTRLNLMTPLLDRTVFHDLSLCRTIQVVKPSQTSYLSTHYITLTTYKEKGFVNDFLNIWQRLKAILFLLGFSQNKIGEYNIR